MPHRRKLSILMVPTSSLEFDREGRCGRIFGLKDIGREFRDPFHIIPGTFVGAVLKVMTKFFPAKIVFEATKTLSTLNTNSERVAMPMNSRHMPIKFILVTTCNATYVTCNTQIGNFGFLWEFNSMEVQHFGVLNSFAKLIGIGLNEP